MNRGIRLRNDKIHLQSNTALAGFLEEDRVIWDMGSGKGETGSMRVLRTSVLCMLYRSVLRTRLWRLVSLLPGFTEVCK